MTSEKEIKSLSDDELLRRLSDLLSRSRRVESDLVAHIAEVDERKLYAGEACSSMFVYAVEVLHLAEAEAYLRIAAARASRKFPMLLEMLSDGRLHLTGIGKLAPYLTEDNCDELLARSAYKTKRQIEELLAEISPKPDVPPTVRKIPTRQGQAAAERQTEPRPDAVKNETPQSPVPPAEPPARSTMEPLAPSRYKITFTASAELRDKLERLQALMHTDLATAIEASVTEKLERLEAKRYAETDSPRKTLEQTDTSPKSRYIPAAVRRFVRRRDGGQCRFVNKQGRRCTERRDLEFHHHYPFGRGGDHNPDHISLMCRRHNVYFAEREYGKEVMGQYRGNDDCVSEPAPVYGGFGRLSLGNWIGFDVRQPWPEASISLSPN